MTVYLDANCVIYLVELNPIWGPKLLTRISSLRDGGSRVAVGDLARTECLAQPFLKGNAAVIADFQAFFSSADVDVLPLTAEVCEKSSPNPPHASLFQLKVPDCLASGHMLSSTSVISS